MTRTNNPFESIQGKQIDMSSLTACTGIKQTFEEDRLFTQCLCFSKEFVFATVILGTHRPDLQISVVLLESLPTHSTQFVNVLFFLFAGGDVATL